MANVFMGVPTLQGPPDISNVLQMLSEGLQQRRERNQNLALGKSLASGDYAGAEQQAYQQGNIGVGLKLHELSGEQQQTFANTIARIAAGATDEASWEPIRQRIHALTGQDPGDFATGRQALIDEASTLPQILERQDKAAKAAAAPPVIEDYDPATGQPRKKVWDAAKQDYVPMGGVKAPSKGIRVTTNPDGSTTTEIGGEGTGLGTKAVSDIEQKQVQAAESGARIAGIMAEFKPEYLTIPSRLGFAWSSMKAKFDANSLAPGEQKQLSEYAAFRRKASENMSQYLHDMSGAAISPKEMDRLVNNLPNPGAGIFDADDPISFKAKMNDTMDQVQKALVRLNYYKIINGIPASLDAIPLTKVKNIEGKWYLMDGGQVFKVGAP